MRKKKALEILKNQKTRLNSESFNSVLWFSEFSLHLENIFPLSSKTKIRVLKLFFETTDTSLFSRSIDSAEFPVCKVNHFIDMLIEELDFAGTESSFKRLPMPFNNKNFWVITAFFLLTGLVILSNVLLVKEENQKIGEVREL